MKTQVMNNDLEKRIAELEESLLVLENSIEFANETFYRHEKVFMHVKEVSKNIQNSTSKVFKTAHDDILELEKHVDIVLKKHGERITKFVNYAVKDMGLKIIDDLNKVHERLDKYEVRDKKST